MPIPLALTATGRMGYPMVTKKLNSLLGVLGKEGPERSRVQATLGRIKEKKNAVEEL